MNCLALVPEVLLSFFLSVNGDLSPQQQENLCAQIRQESQWLPGAVSPAGARGLAQFMRSTAGDIGPAVGCPEWGQAFDPGCSIAMQREYMSRLLRSRIAVGNSPIERWHLAVASYNAGLGWIRKERRLCAGPLHPDCDPQRWTWDGVSTVCLRSKPACRETRHYVEAIFDRYGAKETDALPR